MPRPQKGVIPTFAGLQPFGDPSRFRARPFSGTAAEADAFTGAAAGTTVYAPAPGVAISGYLIGATTAAVQSARAALAGLAWQSGPALLPTRLTWRGWDLWSSCRFAPTDLVFDAAGIVPVSQTYAAGYQLAYRLILRLTGGPAAGGFGGGGAIAGEWGPQPGQTGPDFTPGSGRWIRPAGQSGEDTGQTYHA